MEGKSLTLLLLYLLVQHVIGQNPATQTISGVLRDQAPNTMATCTPSGSAGIANGGQGFFGTDFQLPLGYYQNDEKGLVGPQCDSTNNFTNCGQIGVDRTPVYAYNGTSPGKNIQSPQTFYNWFHTTEQNLVFNHSVVLTLSSPNTYGYLNDSFFPLDGLGWNDHCNYHNYAYCYEVHTRFGYNGGEVFEFTGDDDVWAFINGQLVIDLGSLHLALSLSVSLDDIPSLTKGQNYVLDFFYCERHTVLSDMQITTSLAPYCGYYDWCGICEGNGQSCCTQQILQTTCNDNNPCTTDLCAIQTSPVGNPTAGCQHILLNCTAPDACHSAACNITTGACGLSTINCNDQSVCTIDSCDTMLGCQHVPISCATNNECLQPSCDPVKGCQYSNITCNDDNACTLDTCIPSSGCSFPPISCNPNNLCLSYSCNTVSGCSTANVSCDDMNVCTLDSCAPATGCSHTNISCNDNAACTVDFCIAGNGPTSGCAHTLLNCSENDPCTDDSCSNSTGCIHAPHQCASRSCFTAQCISAQGGCIYTPFNCDDSNACTIDSCDNSTSTGSCAHKPILCQTSDACLNSTCNPLTGLCVSSNITCNDNNPCTTDECLSASGCSFPPISCGVSGCAVGNCNDSNACTNDICNANDTCSNPPITCAPGDLCHISSCDSVLGCLLTPVNCNDGNPCTTDACVSATGSCAFTPIPGFCLSCGNVPCNWTDTCNPLVCNNVTSTCQVQPVSCNDNNLCTLDSCNGTGPTYQCVYAPSLCSSTNSCAPSVCDAKLGCVSQAVNCDDGNPCTVDSCAVQGANFSCIHTLKQCASSNLCAPQVCNATTGSCDTVPVVCNDGNICTNDSCNPATGTCSVVLLQCGDVCNPAVCNTTTGACDARPISCDDGNPCTVDALQCLNTTYQCTHTINPTQCDDGNLCTNDVCNTNAPAGTNPCQYTNVTCTVPDACHQLLGCFPTKGCVVQPLNCSVGTWCNPGSCDPTAGCVSELKVCPNKDIGCYTTQCIPGVNATANGTCVLNQVPNFNDATGKGGVLCPLLYNNAAKTAAIAGGTLAGVIIGAVAGAALVGFGGKKGYDYLMASSSPIKDVGTNPLYAPSGGSGENPLFKT